MLPFNEFRKFQEFVEKQMDIRPYICRGHCHRDWHLTSTLDRLAEDLKAEFADLETKHKDLFKRTIRGRRGPYAPQIDGNELWALGQHNSLATPLLDWTRSPYVALFFAFADRHVKTGQRVVWLLDSVEARRVDPGIQVFSPDTDENSRLISQDGLFTYVEGGGALDDRVRAAWGSADPRPSRPVLIKTCIDNNQRDMILRSLNRMNINYATLFPDLYGAALHCNLSSQVTGY